MAFPAWHDGVPQSLLEGALAGIPLVLGAHAGVQQFFGTVAHYCHPGDGLSICRAVFNAYQEKSLPGDRRDARSAFIRAKSSWEVTGAAWKAAYQQVMNQSETVGAFRRRSVRRLEIGSGDSPLPGYEHLDIRPDLPHVEHVHDIQTPLPFEDGTFDEILSQNCLEHISWRRVTLVIRDWGRVLKPGGLLRLKIPDLEYLVRTYLAGQMDDHIGAAYVEDARGLLGDYTPSIWATIKLFGGQEYPDNFHRAVFDFMTLHRLLETCGFERIERMAPDHALNVTALKAGRETRSSTAVNDPPSVRERR